jgi:hypothetical protein
MLSFIWWFALVARVLVVVRRPLRASWPAVEKSPPARAVDGPLAQPGIEFGGFEPQFPAVVRVWRRSPGREPRLQRRDRHREVFRGAILIEPRLQFVDGFRLAAGNGFAGRCNGFVERAQLRRFAPRPFPTACARLSRIRFLVRRDSFRDAEVLASRHVSRLPVSQDPEPPVAGLKRDAVIPVLIPFPEKITVSDSLCLIPVLILRAI